MSHRHQDKKKFNEKLIQRDGEEVPPHPTRDKMEGRNPHQSLSTGLLVCVHCDTHTCKIHINAVKWAGEMAQQGRAFTALTNDLSSVTSVTPSVTDEGPRHACGEHTDIGRTPMHMK